MRFPLAAVDMQMGVVVEAVTVEGVVVKGKIAVEADDTVAIEELTVVVGILVDRVGVEDTGCAVDEAEVREVLV